ncbi:MAG: thioredoxin domain-containing protein [Ferruginibacter sp.]
MTFKDSGVKAIFVIQLITLILVVIILLNNLSVSGPVAASSQPVEARISVNNHAIEVDSKNDYTFGNPHAKNFLIVYSNYHCDYCHYFYTHVFDSLYTPYVLTGKLKIICKSLVDSTDNKGLMMAKIAEVGRQTSHFIEIHKLLLHSSESIDSTEIIGLGLKAGISEVEIKARFNSEETISKIKSDNLSAKELNIKGTPSFVLNGTVHLGYMTYEDIASKL